MTKRSDAKDISQSIVSTYRVHSLYTLGPRLEGNLSDIRRNDFTPTPDFDRELQCLQDKGLIGKAA
jgi:hypothetical protein